MVSSRSRSKRRSLYRNEYELLYSISLIVSECSERKSTGKYHKMEAINSLLQQSKAESGSGGGGGVHPYIQVYICYIGMYGPVGYGF